MDTKMTSINLMQNSHPIHGPAQPLLFDVSDLIVDSLLVVEGDEDLQGRDMRK